MALAENQSLDRKVDMPAPLDSLAESLERHTANHESPIVAGAAPAWEQIEFGRFMPRRIRGSFLGGVLG